MNPHTTIRPWLLVCLKQFGCREVHDYRWPDADTRPENIYCTYRMVQSVPVSSTELDLTAEPGAYDVTTRRVNAFETTVQVDLYNSQDGLYELCACGVGANVQKIKEFFEGTCRFKEVSSVTNESEPDDEVWNYHHRLICTFNEFVEISITEINAYVEQIDLTIDDGTDYPTYEITRSGITVT